MMEKSREDIRIMLTKESFGSIN